MKRITFDLRTRVSITAAIFFLPLSTSVAQNTQIDLKSQTKGADFSKASVTKPFKTGTTLPANCTVGDSFFKTDAQSGQNIYACTAGNVWTAQGSSGVPSASGYADRLLGSNGTAANWIALGGDIGGAPQSLLVSGLQGKRVAATTPTDGQVLRWNGSTLNWEPGMVSSSGSQTTNTGGDLFGLITNATVTRVQNQPVSAVVPTDGQVLVWNQASGQWVPQSVSVGGGGSGTTGGASLSVLGVTLASANTLTIGSGCSSSNPCNVRFGNNVISVTSGATVTWQSGSGIAYIYVTPSGTLSVGSNLSLTCTSGCTFASGITNFPINSIPLYTWNATVAGWDAASGRDARAYLSNKVLSPGTGVLLVESAQQSTIGIDSTLVPTYTTGSTTLAFGTLAAATCSGDLPVAVPGALAGDAIAPGWPATLPASVLGTMRVTSSNVVAVRLCNVGNTAASITSSLYRATVVRGL